MVLGAIVKKKGETTFPAQSSNRAIEGMATWEKLSTSCGTNPWTRSGSRLSPRTLEPLLLMPAPVLQSGHRQSLAPAYLAGQACAIESSRGGGRAHHDTAVSILVRQVCLVWQRKRRCLSRHLSSMAITTHAAACAPSPPPPLAGARATPSAGRGPAQRWGMRKSPSRTVL